MSAHPKRLATNAEVNQGSILLLFNDIDAEVVRSWRFTRRADESHPSDAPISN